MESLLFSVFGIVPSRRRGWYPVMARFPSFLTDSAMCQGLGELILSGPVLPQASQSRLEVVCLLCVCRSSSLSLAPCVYVKPAVTEWVDDGRRGLSGCSTD